MTMNSLQSALQTLPVIDTHEHVRDHSTCRPRSSVTDFALGFYLNTVLHHADPRRAPTVLDTRRPDRDRWSDFCRLWPRLRFTGYGLLLRHILIGWNLPGDPDESLYDPLRERLQGRSPDQSRRAFEQAGIRQVITHYLAHPNCGGLPSVAAFLTGQAPIAPPFHPLLGLLPFHEFFSRADLDAVSGIVQQDLGSLPALEQALGTLLEQAVARGAVGFKDHAAYSRGLAFGPPDRTAAEHELHQILNGIPFPAGARRLSDYLFHTLIRRTIDLGRPLAIHTGYLVGGADPKANVRHFTPILDAYPEARFDLYHLNYPWHEDLLAVLKQYPNTRANCCWAHIVDPAATRRFLESALGTLPAHRIFAFGGDFTDLPEATVAHLAMARTVVAEVLESARRRGWCSADDALDIARLWFHDNPAEFYRLPPYPSNTLRPR